VKKTFGGSRWKLRELTRVRRFLAYVTLSDNAVVFLMNKNLIEAEQSE
jgi:hypothetical protein